MKKRVLALLLAATMVFGLAACGGSGDTADNATVSDEAGADDASDAEDTDAAQSDDAADAETEADTTASTGEKILSVQIGPNPETIDPALNSAVDGGNMLLHSFECLLAVDQDGKLIPGDRKSVV